MAYEIAFCSNKMHLLKDNKDPLVSIVISEIHWSPVTCLDLLGASHASGIVPSWALIKRFLKIVFSNVSDSQFLFLCSKPLTFPVLSYWLFPAYPIKPQISSLCNMCTYKITMLCTLNLHRAICQSYLNEDRGGKEDIHKEIFAQPM